MRARRRLLVLVCLPLLFGSRCSVVGTGPEPRNLREALERWEDAGIDDYTFDLQRVCFCAGGVDPVRIVVRDGSAVSYTVVATGEPLTAEWRQWYPTVDGLFDFLEDAIERDAHRIDVDYDPGHGVPVHVFVDYDENVADEEMGYEVTAFTAN
jgi:hypothetical protein